MSYPTGPPPTTMQHHQWMVEQQQQQQMQPMHPSHGPPLHGGFFPPPPPFTPGHVLTFPPMSMHFPPPTFFTPPDTMLTTPTDGTNFAPLFPSTFMAQPRPYYGQIDFEGRGINVSCQSTAHARVP
jgi:hypothetical protein